LNDIRKRLNFWILANHEALDFSPIAKTFAGNLRFNDIGNQYGFNGCQCSAALPFSCFKPALRHQLSGEGLALDLDTEDFSCWEAAVATTLGHHRSELVSADEPFHARFRIGQLGGYGVLHLWGRGRLRLSREQHRHSVLWLPMRGMTQETINGEPWLAEPGTGLLFVPGDGMVGDTSQELEGLSILIPKELAQLPGRFGQRLLAQGPLEQAILASARQLAAAAAGQPLGAAHAADQLTDALQAWRIWHEQPPSQERLTSRRRRDTIQQARQWMATRLGDRFELAELSDAVGVSPRQLQYSFLQELGRSPMAEAKRLRVQSLRSLLLDPSQNHRSIAELMAASGLIASGVTSADYRHWCGESPRQTRLKRQLHDAGLVLAPVATRSRLARKMRAEA
jgi:AraC-like DNA-binding protein